MMSDPAGDQFTTGERLRRAADIVDQWAKTTVTPHPVHPGSSLAADDALFPVSSISHLAWFGIAHAVDHLHLFLHVLVRDGLSYPMAPQTLARGGLIGAAHSLWLLDGPDRRTRQLRGLRIAHEEWRNERNAYKDIAETGEADEGMATIIETRTEWMTRAVTAGESIGFTSAEVKTRPNDTTLIKDVLTRYESHEPPEPGEMSMAAGYKLHWQMLSGSAHGYRWSSLGRVEFTESKGTSAADGVDGLMAADEDDHWQSVGALMLLINRAFELFDQRRIRYT
ncbi:MULTISPECIES: hypothetical protein [unclassified Pseudonocardia]|uniref:hypothetical protein n=1 Tax=unclassified Pseudonocardia TaxID=2619320 RepID=UPI0001FFDDBA|nr:hypothetical protein [Pseudonocardia sp. Ae707_Ps1]OLM09126.1 hypothetical protein Ae707Ps1_6073c [Pseudonocardia sp. Ae707_Ps1]